MAFAVASVALDDGLVDVSVIMLSRRGCVECSLKTSHLHTDRWPPWQAMRMGVCHLSGPP